MLVLGAGLRRATADRFRLWGVAASTTGAPTDVCAASDALAAIAHLKARIERLEESIGQLLLDKDQPGQKYKGGSCCMTFTDAPPGLERGVSAAGGNCCVTFHKSSKMDQERRKQLMSAWLMFGTMICLTIILITFAVSGKRTAAGVPERKST